MADWTFTRDSLFTPKARQRVRVTVTATTPGARQYPENYQFHGGQYFETFVESGDLHVRRSHSATPPFAWDLTVTSTADVSYPVLDMLPRGVVIVLYERVGPDVYRRLSYDEGLTWTDEELAIAGGSKPKRATNPFDGAEIEAAREAASGKIIGQIRESGEAAFGTPFYFKDSAAVDLLWEDDTFGLSWGYVTHNPLMLHAVADGETDTSTWRSYDGGRTWEREP